MITYSFIIPHHNSPELVQRLVDSIPQRKDIEIIIADDNSDSGKKAVVVRPDVKIIYIDQNHSRWAGHARNVAMEEACGKWLLFADADDFYVPGFIDILDQYVDSDNDIVFFDANSVDSNTLKPASRTSMLNKAISQYSRNGEGVDDIRYKMRTPWHKMVRKSLIDRNHIRFEEICKGNDMQYSFLTSYYAKKFVIICKPLYTCTYSNQSMSFTKRNTESYLCSIENIYKTRNFYAFVGHPTWRGSIVEVYKQALKRDGLFSFFRLIYSHLKNYKVIQNKASLYVDIIKKNECI